MSIAHLTFIDIETTPQRNDAPAYYYADKPFEENEFNLFKKKFRDDLVAIGPGGSTWLFKETYEQKAGLYAEFGKVVAISIGKMVTEKNDMGEKPIDKFYIRTLVDRDEIKLLTQAKESIERAGGTLVGHNAMEFDFPFLMRRYMINGLPIPKQLDVAGLKPWETKLDDTMKMWSATQWNYKVSLELLCHVLGLPSPKKEMDGSGVAELFYDGTDESLKKIGEYCAGDTLSCAQVYCRMKGLPKIENVEYV